MKKINLLVSAALVIASTSVMAQSKFEKDHAASFKANGIAGMDRLDRDETQKFCSDPATLGGKGDAKKREAIEKANMATIKLPSDGKYLGDWKEGEKIAQSGRGAHGQTRLTRCLLVVAITATKSIRKKFLTATSVHHYGITARFAAILWMWFSTHGERSTTLKPITHVATCHVLDTSSC